MNEYVDVTLICEGAVERDETFGTYAEAETWARNEAEMYAAEAPEASVEIFLQYHGHSPDVEDCSCVQYETDSHPWYTNEQGSASYTVAITLLLAGLAYLAAHVFVWAWTLSSAVGKGLS